MLKVFGKVHISDCYKPNVGIFYFLAKHLRNFFFEEIGNTGCPTIPFVHNLLCVMLFSRRLG
jgi:hypothetical protein